MNPTNASVLVIEDDPDIRALLESRIERLGYDVSTAETGEEGVRVALANPPVLLIVDIFLPGIDGWDVIRQLRVDGRTSDVPVIVATILDRPAEFPVTISDYLPKPFRGNDVEDVIARVLPRPAGIGTTPDPLP